MLAAAGTRALVGLLAPLGESRRAAASLLAVVAARAAASLLAVVAARAAAVGLASLALALLGAPPLCAVSPPGDSRRSEIAVPPSRRSRWWPPAPPRSGPRRTRCSSRRHSAQCRRRATRALTECRAVVPPLAVVAVRVAAVGLASLALLIAPPLVAAAHAAAVTLAPLAGISIAVAARVAERPIVVVAARAAPPHSRR